MLMRVLALPDVELTPSIIIIGAEVIRASTRLNEGLGISSIAATCMNFLGFTAPEDYDKSVINLA